MILHRSMTDGRVLGMPVQVRNARVAARAGQTLGTVVVPPHTLIDLPIGQVFLDVSTAAARRRAAWTILRRTAKPTDGWVSRHLNRPISRLISYALLSLRLRPSHASALTLLVGLAAGLAAAQPGYGALVTAGLLFQLASILDGVDGEMARATLTESKAGAQLDTIVDQASYVACFIGQAIGWAREGSGSAALTWTVVIGAALVLSLLRAGRFVARYAGNASFVAIDRAVRRAARDTGRLSLRLAAGLFTLLRRDLFALLFLAVSLTGVRALIPILVGAGIVIANVTFSLHHADLAAAATAERAAHEAAQLAAQGHEAAAQRRET
jgi:CDP-L-myo-inositol myo-inositolphosphotransferase